MHLAVIVAAVVVLGATSVVYVLIDDTASQGPPPCGDDLLATFGPLSSGYLNGRSVCMCRPRSKCDGAVCLNDPLDTTFRDLHGHRLAFYDVDDCANCQCKAIACPAHSHKNVRGNCVCEEHMVCASNATDTGTGCGGKQWFLQSCPDCSCQPRECPAGATRGDGQQSKLCMCHKDARCAGSACSADQGANFPVSCEDCSCLYHAEATVPDGMVVCSDKTPVCEGPQCTGDSTMYPRGCRYCRCIADPLIHRANAERVLVLTEHNDADCIERMTTIDVVLVHGLAGHYFGTFNLKSRDVFWPIDLLLHSAHGVAVNGSSMYPANHPAPRVRVLSVSHPHDPKNVYGVDNGDDLSGIGTAALSKMQASVSRILRRLKSKCVVKGKCHPDALRPVVFVAHSLGGLLTKEMLLADPELASRTLGVVFLGTPHRGSEKASLLAMLTQAIRETGLDGAASALGGVLGGDDSPQQPRTERYWFNWPGKIYDVFMALSELQSKTVSAFSRLRTVWSTEEQRNDVLRSIDPYLSSVVPSVKYMDPRLNLEYLEAMHARFMDLGVRVLNLQETQPVHAGSAVGGLLTIVDKPSSHIDCGRAAARAERNMTCASKLVSKNHLSISKYANTDDRAFELVRSWVGEWIRNATVCWSPCWNDTRSPRTSAAARIDASGHTQRDDPNL